MSDLNLSSFTAQIPKPKELVCHLLAEEQHSSLKNILLTGLDEEATQTLETTILDRCPAFNVWLANYAAVKNEIEFRKEQKAILELREGISPVYTLDSHDSTVFNNETVGDLQEDVLLEEVREAA